MLEFKLDDRDFKQFEKDIKTFHKKIYPRATGSALNRAVSDGRIVAIQIIDDNMILRNRWTERSIQFERVKGFDVNRMEARLGSTMNYMEDQEFGGQRTKKGKKGVAIPTAIATGEGEGASPKKKVVRKPNRRSSIKLKRARINSSSKRQHIAATIRAAAEQGGRNKFIYLPLNQHPGIYKVMGGKKKPRIKQIYDLSKKTTPIPRNPWLKPTVDFISPNISKYFVEAATFHMKKAGFK